MPNSKNSQELQDDLETKVISCFMSAAYSLEQNDLAAKRTIEKYLSIVSPSDFVVTENRNVFIAYSEVYARKNTISPQLCLQYLVEKNSEVNTEKYWNIVEQAYAYGTIAEHVESLKGRSFTRAMKREVSTFLTEFAEDQTLDNVLEAKENLITKLTSMQVEQTVLVDWDETRKKFYENLKSNKQLEGHSWGISGLNAYTSGIEKGKLYIMGGLKKGGKTRLAINTMHALGEKQIACGMIEMEMPGYDCYKLFLARKSKIPDNRMKVTGLLDAKQKEFLKKCDEQIPWDKYKLTFCPGINKRQLSLKIQDMIYDGCEVIVIDFLQRVVKLTNNETTELTDISNMIADLAKNHGVSIIALSQLQNVAEKEVPTIAHLRGSGGIADAADCIILMDNLYRRTKKDDAKNRVDLHIEQRIGDPGTVKCWATLGNCFFIDLEDKKEMDAVSKSTSGDDEQPF